MIPVTQKQLYTSPTERGSCLQACYASLFELEHDAAPGQRDISPWLRLNYPNVAHAKVELPEPSAVAPAPKIGERLHWIAAVHTTTPGFTDACGKCWMYEGNDHGPAIFDTYDVCPWCGAQFGLEKGIRPGYHAVVMLGSELAWDPHPNADYDRELVFVAYEWFYVRDVARLEPRRLPVLK